MDPFFWATNISKLLQEAQSIVLLVTIVFVVIFAGERLFGLDVKGVIDNAEALMEENKRSGGGRGTPWPAIVLVLGGLFAILWLVRGV